jgi:asparagine N-glycosylation enzyme membrane subunit Stt3
MLSAAQEMQNQLFYFICGLSFLFLLWNVVKSIKNKNIMNLKVLALLSIILVVSLILYSTTNVAMMRGVLFVVVFLLITLYKFCDEYIKKEIK